MQKVIQRLIRFYFFRLQTFRILTLCRSRLTGGALKSTSVSDFGGGKNKEKYV